MEVIINDIEVRSFSEISEGKTFSDDRGELMIKVSGETALCFSNEQSYFFRGDEICFPKDCVIIERDLYENLRRASRYE